MSAAVPEISNSAFLTRSGSPPAIAPMICELTASPIQLYVMTNPIAVPVIRGNPEPTSASVVGNTGAIEMPARKTNAPALVLHLGRNEERHIQIVVWRQAEIAFSRKDV